MDGWELDLVYFEQYRSLFDLASSTYHVEYHIPVLPWQRDLSKHQNVLKISCSIIIRTNHSCEDYMKYFFNDPGGTSPLPQRRAPGDIKSEW